MNKSFFLIFSIILLSSLVLGAVNYDNDTYKITTWVPDWLGGDGTSTVKLISNTDYCLVDCEATIEFNNTNSVNLIDEINFLNKDNQDVSDSIKELTFSLGKYENVTKKDYSKPIYSEEQECYESNSTNSTNTTECYYPVLDYEEYTEEELVFNEYSGEEVQGYSQLIIKAKKNPMSSVDWIITFRGKELTNWAWWNGDWDYKREINITENSGSSLTNYSVLIYVPYDAHMNSNFSDLRFLDSTETEELSYWIENKTDSNFAWVWVKVPTLTASSNTFINMYYGNSGASSNSNYEIAILSTAITDNHGKTLSTNASDLSYGSRRGYYITPLEDIILLQVSRMNDGVSNFDGISVQTGTTHIINLTTTTGNFSSFLRLNKLQSYIFTIYNYTSSLRSYKFGSFGGYPLNGNLIQWTNGDAFYSNTHHTDTNGFSLDGFVSIFRASSEPTYTIGDEEANSGSATMDYVTPPTPENNSNLSVSYIPVEVDVNYTNATLENITFDFYKGGVLNASYFYENETYFVNHSGCTCDNWAFNVTLCYFENISNTTSCITTSTRNVLIDILPPTINITSPLTHYDYLYDNQTLDLNFTVEDNIAGVDSCWYNYNGVLINSYSSSELFDVVTIENPQNSFIEIYDEDDDVLLKTYNNNSCNNITIYNYIRTEGSFAFGYTNITCDNIVVESFPSEFSYAKEYRGWGTLNRTLNCSENTTFNYIAGSNNLTMYSNDTFGNVGSETRSWNTFILQNNFIFDNETFEGLNNIFINNVTLNGLIQNAYLEYAGVNYTSSITTNDYNYLYNSISIPNIETDINNSFYWWILINNTWIQSINNTQLVKAVSVTNCSNGTLLNLTLQDEKTQANINGTFEVLLNIISPLGTNVITYNNTFTNRNNVQFCLAPNDTDKNLFELNAQIRYYSTGYVYELYNIQNANLSDYPQSIILYDVADNESTTFKVIYKGNNFVIKEGVLVQLLRKYIGEDSYKVVEAPVTSSLGEVILHVDLNNNLYNIIISEDGVVLDTYENIVFACDSELTGLCTFNLDGIINPYNSVTVEQLTDIQYSISTINETHVMVTFSTSSGTPATVQLTVEENSITGQSQIYNNTVYSSAGSFIVGMDTNTTLGIGSNVYNFVLVKDGEVIAIKDFLLDNQDMEWDNNNYFIVIILLLSVVGMAFTSPELVIFNAVLTFLLAGSIWLFQGMNFAIGLGALLWLVVAAGILIYKLSQQEDR